MVGGTRLLQGQLFGDTDEAVELRVERLDALQQVLGQFDGGKLLGSQAFGNLAQGQLVQAHYSITLGTRYRPFSTAGAMAW